MAVARYPSFVIDCPDPSALAAFYGGLLGWETLEREGWAEIRPADGSDCICFQRVADYRPPRWPSAEAPQQMHLDLVVEDLAGAEAEVLSGGGALLSAPEGASFRVYRDPAGHPFCLCTS